MEFSKMKSSFDLTLSIETLILKIRTIRQKLSSLTSLEMNTVFTTNSMLLGSVLEFGSSYQFCSLSFSILYLLYRWAQIIKMIMQNNLYTFLNLRQLLLKNCFDYRFGKPGWLCLDWLVSKLRKLMSDWL